MNEYIKTTSHGSKFYYKDKAMKIRHREDGPAVEYSNGNKVWYLNDKRHRMDGPAQYAFSGYNSWWINGVFIFMVGKNGKVTDRMR